MTYELARRIVSSGLALLILPGARPGATARGKVVGITTTLSATEAKILVYVSSVGEGVRASGFDIGMEQQTSAQLNRADYYYFWVYNAKRGPPHGSVTIGYYAVNKYTGDVWDIDGKKQLSSKLLEGVQRIVRGSHHIGEDTIARYRGRPF